MSTYRNEAMEELGYEGTYGSLTPEQRAKVDDLVEAYKARGKDTGEMSDLGKGIQWIKDKLKKDKKVIEKKNGGSVEGKRLTRTIPPKKGPNSQGMRGTGAAIRGTKFKGVF